MARQLEEALRQPRSAPEGRAAARNEPSAPPAPGPPPQASAPPASRIDPFSVEEIEAEFARLLGRPLDKGDKG
jgi:hypothetical protein